MDDDMPYDENEEIDEDVPDALDDEILQEHLDYLDEVMKDYGRFVNNIGKNGPSAKLMLNYRDEIQDVISFLNNYNIDLSEYWTELMRLDQMLRIRRTAVVGEIGHRNFLMEQVKRDPPKDHWWWYLDRSVPKKNLNFGIFLKNHLIR